jgi:hypothetical protein
LQKNQLQNNWLQKYQKQNGVLQKNCFKNRIGHANVQEIRKFVSEIRVAEKTVLRMRQTITRAKQFSELYNVLFQIFKWTSRELSNLLTALIPWERRVKMIEAQFGTVVASYFVFLRWLCWLNIGIAAIFITFVIVPEIIGVPIQAGDDRKTLLPSEEPTAFDFITLWNFEGFLRSGHVHDFYMFEQFIYVNVCLQIFAHVLWVLQQPRENHVWLSCSVRLLYGWNGGFRLQFYCSS